MSHWHTDALRLWRAGRAVESLATHFEVELGEMNQFIANYLAARELDVLDGIDLIREIDRLDFMRARLSSPIAEGNVRAVMSARKLDVERRALVEQLRARRRVAGANIELVQPDPDPSVWKRQPSETSKAYRAFECYRDAGPARTMVEAYEVYRSKAGLRSQKPPASFFGWAKDYNWNDRALAFDNDITDVIVSRRVDVIASVQERFLDFAEEAASGMIAMARGHGADHARIHALRDILDRVGITRHRARPAGSLQTTNVSGENVQVNIELGQMPLEEKLALANALGEE